MQRKEQDGFDADATDEFEREIQPD